MERVADGAPVRALLEWYARHARDLPWRRTRDPYAIWVSEVMLQQTQVKTVVPYWERWMRTFPDVRALAEAELERVLKSWEGLGYYRRARNLVAGARQIVEEHGGVFPRTLEAVQALPGVGRYTAGAICSIAFDMPVPVLDGNVARVFSRLDAVSDDPKERAAHEALWAKGTRWVEVAAMGRGEGDCGALNQALMELGATVCTPRAPACDRCPLSEACEGRKRGDPERFPRSPTRPAVTTRAFVVAVVFRGDRVLVRRRDDDAVNGGLWEFPNSEVAASPGGRIQRPAPWSEGWIWDSDKPVHEFRHSITRYRITEVVYTACWRERSVGSFDVPRTRWCGPEELERLPMSSAHRRIASWVAERSQIDSDEEPAGTRRRRE